MPSWIAIWFWSRDRAEVIYYLPQFYSHFHNFLGGYVSGSSAPTETIECPLCCGAGKLKRPEVLDRLGVKDFARVAQLSAEEAFRLLQQKNTHDHQTAWSRFENELAKRTTEIEQRYRDELRTVGGRIKELESAALVAEELHALDVQLGHADSEAKLLTAQSQKEDLSRRVEDCLREVAQLRERNQQLEAEMSKVARVGRLEEISFADEARTWAGICISEKLPRNGDFILAYRGPNGDPTEPQLLIDNKDKSVIAESDVDKLVRDARDRSIPVAALVVRDESQLRQIDRESRWSSKDGVWLLRTTRPWLPRDLDILKPIFERMRVQGFDLLERNAVLAEELRRSFPEIDRIEKELGKAAKAIQSVSALVVRYRERLRDLCDSAASAKVAPKPERDGGNRQTAGA
jgi:vacuolar-type H+-ATPase subunit I/STV1